MLAEEQKGPRGWGRVWIRVRIRQGSHAALAVVIGQLAQDVGRWTAGALDGGALILGSVSSYPQRDRPHSQGTGGWATKPVIIAQHGFYRGPYVWALLPAIYAWAVLPAILAMSHAWMRCSPKDTTKGRRSPHDPGSTHLALFYATTTTTIVLRIISKPK